MTQGQKKLLMKDLCARLNCGVICSDLRHGDSRITDIYTVNETVYCIDFDEYVEIKYIKPYLRPMSSMTDEELSEYRFVYRVKNIWDVVDWLNEHHFDYRGLIEQGLALPATKDMYKD